MISNQTLSKGYAEPAALTPLPRGLDPVETLWTLRATVQRDFLVLPDGRADLIVRFKISVDGACSDVLPLAVGPSSLPHYVAIDPGDGFIGIRLKPGKLGLLKDAAALADRRFSGEQALTLVHELSSLPDRTDTFEAMVEAMRGCSPGLPKPTPHQIVDQALDRIHLAGGRLTPGPLADAIGVNARRLHRLFRTHVGLPPQLYAAVVRFQRAVRLRRRGLSVSATAYEAGYSDQPHMSRAFLRHGGFTPARMPDVQLGWMPFS